MNTANLQLEGLIMAIAAVNRLLVEKGLASVDEISCALAGVEDDLSRDGRLNGDMSPANREAVLFPVKALQLAVQAPAGGQRPNFADLAEQVGRMKDAPR